jgi:hypothetical protein
LHHWYAVIQASVPKQIQQQGANGENNVTLNACGYFVGNSTEYHGRYDCDDDSRHVEAEYSGNAFNEV